MARPGLVPGIVVPAKPNAVMAGLVLDKFGHDNVAMTDAVGAPSTDIFCALREMLMNCDFLHK
jgi:hypothetical protein